MRVAEVAAFHPDAEGEVVKSGHLHVVLQKLKCRAKGRRELEVRRTWSPLRKKKWHTRITVMSGVGYCGL